MSYDLDGEGNSKTCLVFHLRRMKSDSQRDAQEVLLTYQRSFLNNACGSLDMQLLWIFTTS